MPLAPFKEVWNAHFSHQDANLRCLNPDFLFLLLSAVKLFKIELQTIVFLEKNLGMFTLFYKFLLNNLCCVSQSHFHQFIFNLGLCKIYCSLHFLYSSSFIILIFCGRNTTGLFILNTVRDLFYTLTAYKKISFSLPWKWCVVGVLNIFHLPLWMPHTFFFALCPGKLDYMEYTNRIPPFGFLRILRRGGSWNQDVSSLSFTPVSSLWPGYIFWRKTAASLIRPSSQGSHWIPGTALSYQHFRPRRKHCLRVTLQCGFSCNYPYYLRSSLHLSICIICTTWVYHFIFAWALIDTADSLCRSGYWGLLVDIRQEKIK